MARRDPKVANNYFFQDKPFLDPNIRHIHLTSFGRGVLVKDITTLHDF
jgi:hypothetical protein